MHCTVWSDSSSVDLSPSIHLRLVDPGVYRAAFQIHWVLLLSSLILLLFSSLFVFFFFSLSFFSFSFLSSQENITDPQVWSTRLYAASPTQVLHLPLNFVPRIRTGLIWGRAPLGLVIHSFQCRSVCGHGGVFLSPRLFFFPLFFLSSIFSSVFLLPPVENLDGRDTPIDLGSPLLFPSIYHRRKSISYSALSIWLSRPGVASVVRNFDPRRFNFDRLLLLGFLSLTHLITTTTTP